MVLCITSVVAIKTIVQDRLSHLNATKCTGFKYQRLIIGVTKHQTDVATPLAYKVSEVNC